MGSPHKENIQMATRMQQRRGTAAQWTAANPILAAGEIGFETDTSKFKMGNGSSTWSALQYFANASELAAIIGGDMPALLNSLDELAQAINDDPQFYLTMGTNLTNHQNDTTMIHGIVDTALLATTGNVATAAQGAATELAAHASDTTLVHGIADTALLATTGDVATAAQGAATALSAHEADITNVHGIADTSVLATLTNVSTAKSEAIADAATASSTAISTHNSDTTNVHGIADTSLLATTGNVSTAKTEAITAAGEAADTALSTHNSDTSNVHGINDTTVLVTQQELTDAVNGAVVDQSSLAGVGIDWNTGTEAFDIDSTVATKVYADDAVTAHQSDTTSVHGIADTSLLALKSEVDAITKTSLGLGNVDNTADASKPVSTAQSTAIATAKAEAIADATSQVNALLTGAPAALNTLDELAAALGDDANFAATVTTSLGLKVDSLTPISQKTASYTLSSLTERDDLIEMGSASAITLSIPTDATLNYPIGTSIDILQTGAGQVTIAAVTPGTTTVNATPGLKLRTTWSSCTLFKRAANTWVVYGDLTA
jgi:predicted nuclease of predicted toxin-antitoxin system